MFAGGVCTVTSDTININFDAYPVVPILSNDGDLSFCEGDSVGLSHAISGDFEWHNGDKSSVKLYFSTSEMVSITAFSRLGCATKSVDYEVVKSENPSKPTIVKLEYPVTDSLKSSELADIYHWMVDGQDVRIDAQVIPLLMEGNYSVILESFAGCFSEESDALSTVGVKELLTAPLSIHRENGRVMVTSQHAILKASLYSNDGKLLKKYKSVDIIEIPSEFNNSSKVLQVLTDKGYLSLRIY